MDIKRSGNPLAAVAVLPAFLISFNRNHTDHTFVLGVFIGLAVLAVALFNVTSYTWRTPLVRVDEEWLTFFGSSRSQQRSVRRDTISSICLSRRPNFWRSSFRFSIITNGEMVDLWIPASLGGSVRALARELRGAFPGQFHEVIG